MALKNLKLQLARISILFVFVFFLICSACVSKKSDTTVKEALLFDTTNFYNAALLGNPGEVDSSSIYMLFFEYMRKNDLRRASSLLQNNGFVLTDLSGGGFLLTPSASNQNSRSFYVSFRFKESQDDISITELRKLLLRAHELLENSDTTTVKPIIELEYDFLSLYDEDWKIDERKLMGFVDRKEAIYSTNRALYLKAKACIDAGQYLKGRDKIDKILKVGADINTYNLLINHFDKVDLDSALYYSRKKKELCEENCCDLFTLKYNAFSERNSVAFWQEYNKCVGSLSISDSVKAQSFLAEYYLSLGNFKSADSIAEIFYKRDSEFSFSRLQNIERKAYFNVKSNILFAKEEYQELINFILTEGRSIGIIGYKNTIDNVRTFLNEVYQSSFLQKNESFDLFFKSKIFPLLEKQISASDT